MRYLETRFNIRITTHSIFLLVKGDNDKYKQLVYGIKKIVAPSVRHGVAFDYIMRIDFR